MERNLDQPRQGQLLASHPQVQVPPPQPQARCPEVQLTFAYISIPVLSKKKKQEK